VKSGFVRVILTTNVSSIWFLPTRTERTLIYKIDKILQMINIMTRVRKTRKDVKMAAANDKTPVVERLTPEKIIENNEKDAAPVSLRQASIQRSMREKINKVVCTKIGGTECPQFYAWGWIQRDKFMALDTPEAKIVRERYQQHLRTIGL